MDPYANYVKNLQARGLSAEQIVNALKEQGFDEPTVQRIMSTLNLPGTSPQPSLQPAVGNQSPQAIAPQPPPPAEAYVDYVKALLARGIDQQAIDAHLAQYGVDQQTRSAIFGLVSQSPVAQSYPMLPPVRRTNTVLGQAPLTVDTPSSEIVSQVSSSSWKGWLITGLICLIPSLFIAFDASNRFSNYILTLLTLSDISATIGLCLYVMDMVLATRLKIVEDWFGGLNKVYIAHAIIGSAALTFIMIHPVLLAIRYMPLGANTAAGLFIPNMKYIATDFGVFALALMLILLILTFYVRLPYKIWLTTHKYLGVVYLLICIHVLFEPNAISGNLFVRLFLIALIIVGLAAYIYRTLLPNVFIRRYVYLVHGVSEKTKGVVEVTLTPLSKAIKFQAGQFIFLSFQADGLSPEWHPFTIVSPPDPQSFDIAIKSLGGYTETLTRLLPHLVGMSVLVEGAYGRFSFRNFHNANQVWIAGGIGITPFLSMAQNLGSGSYNIDLYYSVRSEAELIDIDKLMSAQKNQSDKVFRVFPFVTEKYNRHLSADLIANTSGDLTKREFLICGPEPMMNSMKKQLLQKGVKKYKIHSEEFSIT